MPTAPKIFGQQPGRRKPWANRHAHLRKGLSGATRKAKKREVFMRDDGRCCGCGVFTSLGDSHLDHIIPLSRGGTHDDDNLQTLCLKCSKRKTAGEGA